ncbi:MAG: hypothetical protein ACYTET_06915 [Planctomycetota bacterium]|jgi:hypothetical protein
MRRKQRQNGFILLMVVALIPLVATAAILLLDGSKMLLITTRRQAIKTDAQLACESGLAWIQTNTDKAADIVADQPLTLDVPHPDKTIQCTIKRQDENFQLTGYAADKRFSYEYKTNYQLAD